MSNAEQVLNEVKQFIENYIKRSQERGEMYGSIEEIESNWNILNKINFIIKGIDDEGVSFSDFLLYKGFGAKRASTIIKEKKAEDKYLELTKLWEEYTEWRQIKINPSSPHFK
jgi:hypothetical protein